MQHIKKSGITDEFIEWFVGICEAESNFLNACMHACFAAAAAAAASGTYVKIMKK